VLWNQYRYLFIIIITVTKIIASSLLLAISLLSESSSSSSSSSHRQLSLFVVALLCLVFPRCVCIDRFDSVHVCALVLLSYRGVFCSYSVFNNNFILYRHHGTIVVFVVFVVFVFCVCYNCVIFDRIHIHVSSVDRVRQLQSVASKFSIFILHHYPSPPLCSPSFFFSSPTLKHLK
jgi:hypothetical protein